MVHVLQDKLALALVVAAVAMLGAGCGGGEPATEASGATPLSKAIVRYTGLSPDEADAVAGSVRSTSSRALAALTQAVDGQPPLPSSASVETDLETIGRDRGFEGEPALADLCDAIHAEPSLQPNIQLDPVSGALEVRWPESDPARQLGRAVHRAAVKILNRTSSGYSASFLEQFEDTLVRAATSGVPEESDSNQVLLWLRTQQLRSDACG